MEYVWFRHGNKEYCSKLGRVKTTLSSDEMMCGFVIDIYHTRGLHLQLRDFRQMHTMACVINHNSSPPQLESVRVSHSAYIQAVLRWCFDCLLSLHRYHQNSISPSCGSFVPRPSSIMVEEILGRERALEQGYGWSVVIH